MRTKTSTRLVKILFNVLITIFVTIVLLTDCVCQQSEFRIENPYANVNWVKHGQYKANLHTHTSMGEASTTPQEVIDRFRGLEYSILALTDHDDNVTAETTWPWQEFQRDPDTLGMVAIQGNEISEVHHLGSYFNDYGNPDIHSEEEAIEEIGRRGGLAVFNHPGRYEKTVEWYVDMFRRYDHLIGLEIYNKKDKYPGDRKTWDALLTELLPERSVWGFANDDMHEPEKDLGFSWNVIILPELTSDMVRQALEQGCFFFVHAPNGHSGAPVPVIQSISVEEQSGTIHIKASGHKNIVWVSQGIIVHKGDRLNLVDLPGVNKYIRAEVHGADSVVVGTQPFRIHRMEHKK